MSPRLQALADGFRFTTLALALAPLLPIVGYEQPDGRFVALSQIQVLRLHLAHSADAHPGMFVLLVPSALALISLAVPTARRRPRQALAIVAALVAALELVLVTWPGALAPWFGGAPAPWFGGALAPWFGIDALIPAGRFGRHAWMLVFLTILWTWLEIRPEIEETS